MTVSVIKVSSINGLFDLTEGKMKNIEMAQIIPTEPTVQKGSPNPPRLYRKVPMAGPEKDINYNPALHIKS